MKIHIDKELCSGHGRCYTLSSQIVQADDDGFPLQRGEDIAVRPEDDEDALRIVANCPEGAIKVVDG